MSKLTPLFDVVFVRADSPEDVTKSGIIIPDIAKETQRTGVVVAVGPGTKEESTTVKNGDRVLYDKGRCDVIKHEGEELVMIRESNIFSLI